MLTLETTHQSHSLQKDVMLIEDTLGYCTENGARKWRWIYNQSTLDIRELSAFHGKVKNSNDGI